jgi:hypothetical protein
MIDAHNLENDLLLVNRRWICDGAHERWLCKRNGAVLSFSVVSSTPPDRFKNVLLLMERSFGPGVGGVFRRGQTVIRVEHLDMSHEKFKAMVRVKQTVLFQEEHDQN